MADTTPTNEAAITKETLSIENSAIEETADTMELDLELEEEVIIEDFTIDGICGVY